MSEVSECNEDVASSQLGNPERSTSAKDSYGNVSKRQKTDGNDESSSSSSEHNSQFVSSSNAQLSAHTEQTSFQASSKWQQWRALYKDVFAESEKPAKTQCLACGDDEGDLVRCLDCGPGVTRCIDCTLSYHKECHLLHKPEIVLETGVSPFLLRSRFARKNHQCFTTHTKSIQIFDEKGRLHQCWFTSCACEAPSATLLRLNLWPATPDKPRLAFHEGLLRWFESLQVEGGLSLRAASEAVRRRNSLKPQEADILCKNLSNGCFEEYKQLRRHCAIVGSENLEMKNGAMHTALPKAHIVERNASNGCSEEFRRHRTILGSGNSMKNSSMSKTSPKSSVSELQQESHVPSSESVGQDGMTQVKGHETCSDSDTSLQGHISDVTGIEPQFGVGCPGSSDPSSSGPSPADQNCQEWKVEALDGDDDSEAEYILVPVNEATSPNQNGVEARPVVFPGAPPRVDQELSQFDYPSEVGVMPTANIGKTRVCDKKQYCLYCRAPYSKLPRHLRTMHRDEPDVILLSNTECPITQRHLMTKLRNLGNHLQNTDVLRRGTGKLIVVKRPSPGDPAARNPADYQPCPYCFGYYLLRDQPKHHCALKNLGAESSANWLNLTLQH